MAVKRPPSPSMRSLCIVVFFKFSSATQRTLTHVPSVHVHVYVYVYVCICVCVCMDPLTHFQKTKKTITLFQYSIILLAQTYCCSISTYISSGYSEAAKRGFVRLRERVCE